MLLQTSDKCAKRSYNTFPVRIAITRETIIS